MYGSRHTLLPPACPGHRSIVGWDQRLTSRAGPPDHGARWWSGARVARRSRPTLAHWLRLLAAVIGAFLIAPSHAIAQSVSPNDEQATVDFAGLDIQAMAGWDGTVDTSAPVPFSFLISNFSEDVIEGQLILTDPANNKEVLLGDIFIGPNSVRRCSSIQAVPDWIQCVATLSHEDDILWRRELAITTGKDFSEDFNYLLFVDDGGRMLQWPVDESVADSTSSRFVPKPARGRPVQPLAVKSWQVPQHHGPLTVAQAIVFSETADPDMLNDAQWEAIAKWMCLGGTVFVSDMSTTMIDRLTKAAPLVVQPAVFHEQFSVRRCGGGSVREYSGQLFSADDTETPGLIAEAAARLSRCNALTLLDGMQHHWWESRSADRTRMLVVAVFGIYTLMSGLVTLLLFRLNRRQIATYTVIVVLSACLASAVLGGMLRTSDGDLRWVTLTQAGPGGLVQLARIDLQSAGGRSSQMTVRGRHADLQLIESDSLNFQGARYYYGYGAPEYLQIFYPPFAWQTNLLPEESDVWKIDVPITPWGYRRTYSAAFDPTQRGLEIELKYEPPGEPTEIQNGQQAPTGAQFGQFRLTATNHLPFDLTDCRLVVGSTGVNLLAEAAKETFDPRTGRFQMRNGASVGDLFHIESGLAVGALPASKTVAQLAISMVDSSPDNGAQSIDIPGATTSLPRIPYNGATSAWIIGRIPRSSILSIDEQHSDFKPLQELHLFVQEILPEDMPEEWLQFHQRRLTQQLESAAKANAP